MAGIAADVQREWIGGDAAYARRMETAGPGNAAYPEPKEATFELLRSLHGGLERVETLKLAKPLGRPWRAPARCSPRSGGAAGHSGTCGSIWPRPRALYLGEGGWGLSDFVREVATAPEIDVRLRRGFDAASSSRRPIPGPLDVAVKDPRMRPSVERLLKEVRALSHAVARNTSARPSISRSDSMPAMATERRSPTRRALLLGLGALVAIPGRAARADDRPLYLALARVRRASRA